MQSELLRTCIQDSLDRTKRTSTLRGPDKTDKQSQSADIGNIRNLNLVEVCDMLQSSFVEACCKEFNCGAFEGSSPQIKILSQTHLAACNHPCEPQKIAVKLIHDLNMTCVSGKLTAE